MKRFFLLLFSLFRQRLKLYLFSGLVGALFGVLLLAPSYSYINSRLNNTDPLSSFDYVIHQIGNVLSGHISANDIELMVFYAEIGALLGLLSLFFYKVIHQRLLLIDNLSTELDKDLSFIIEQGEGPYLEFKSSFRWDLVENRVNRSLESVVIKALAGFLNSQKGGTLLIGVADNGEILGLEKDFGSLKKPDQDGFEQAIMTAISIQLGADICPFVHVLYHVIDSKCVCRLIVSPSTHPVFVIQNNTPKFFVRTGGATRDLNTQEAVSYIFDHWHDIGKQHLKSIV
jgi:hypothetical protein